MSAVSHLPTQIRQSTSQREWQGRTANEAFVANLLSADHDGVKTLAVQLPDGRYFSRKALTDTAEGIVATMPPFARLAWNRHWENQFPPFEISAS